MLVEINLLPEREPRKFAFVIILSSLVFLLLIVSAFYFWQLNATKNEITSVDRQISMTQKIAAKETTTTNTASTTNSASQLEIAIKWAKDYPIQTIPVMRKLTSLLPERGFIQSFGYTEAGDVTLTVQFDSAREAAYFLSSLNGSDWIKDASLNSLTTSATADKNSNNAANGQTGATGTANNSGTVVNGSTGSTVNPAAQTNTTTAVQNGQNNSTSSTTTANTASTVTDQYLPRYVGQFQITLNKEVIKKQTNKGTKDQEGVTGS
jgi:Tfp pilus assembly protein PilN